MKILAATIAMVSCAVIFAAAPSHAGPWVQEKDREQIAFTAGYSFSDSVLDDSDNAIPLNNDINQYEFTIYYNGGLGNNQDISIATGYVNTSANTAVDGITKHNNRGLNSTTVRYRKQIYDRHTALALMTGVRLPGTYDDFYLNSAGASSFDVELGFSVGEYYRVRNMYWSTDVTYRLRTGVPRDEVEIDLEAGRVFNDLLIRGLLTYIEQTSGNDIRDSKLFTSPGVISFSSLERDRVRVGGGIDYKIGPARSLGMTYMKTTRGSNILDDTSFYLTYTIQSR
jgi:hypothetical protein